MVGVPSVKHQGRPEDDAGALPALVATLYDAAADPALWPEAMGLTSAYMRAFTTAIYDWSATGATQGFVHDDGKFSLDQKTLYHTRYSRFDPIAAAHRFVAIEQTFSIADVVEVGRYRQSEFYREWTMPLELVDRLVAPIDRPGKSALLFGVMRHERDGVADDLARRRMQLLVPHMRRAVAIGAMIEGSQSHAADLSEVLDGMSAGVFLVDADGRIAHTNAAGQTALGEQLAIVSRDGKLGTVDPAATRALLQSLEAASFTILASRRSSIPILARDGTRFIAHLLPLGAGAQRRVGEGNVVAAVFVQRAGVDAPATAEIVARTFDLTPGERRVLDHIGDPGGIAEVAARLGLSEATVKTHLQKIFAKTGTNKQTELTLLVAGFASPMAH